MWNDKDLTPKMKKLKASGDKEAFAAYQRAFKRSVEWHQVNPIKAKSTTKKTISKKETKPILNIETQKLQKLVSPKKK